MNTNKFFAPILILFSVSSSFSKASALDFTLGAGYPYVLIPEISIASSDKSQRWFANYKVGLDDGFSLGVEQALSANKKHSFGVLIGAVGARNTHNTCSYTDDNNGDIAEEIGSAIDQALGCALAGIFDNRTTNGVGISYHYNFNGLNKDGWKLNLELGYGKVSGVDNKRADGGISVSYQF